MFSAKRGSFRLIWRRTDLSGRHEVTRVPTAPAGASSSRCLAARQPGRSIARAAGRANAADDLTPIFLRQQIAVIKANQAIDNMIGYGPRV